MRQIVAIDIESFDPLLQSDGDGSCRTPGTVDYDGSKILCAGVFGQGIKKAYIPNTNEWQELMDILEDDNIDKIFHNGIYDLTWLVCRYGAYVNGYCHDTMTRMVYIDEYAALDLDSCCKRFHIKGKNKNETIEKWYNDNIENIITAGKILGRDIKKTDKLWKHSLFLWENWQEFRDKMMEYNLQDCEITYNLYFAQENSLIRVYDAYMVDVKLTPLIIQMKRRGILMDNEKLDKLTEQVKGDIDAKEKILADTYGIDLETISSSKKLGERLNKMSIYSPVLTPKGAQSWGVEAMDRLMHYPVIPLIQEVKGYKKLLDTYLYGGMANSILSTGRIHCTFSPNKRESGGTVTGRFSSSKPNLQQIPARDKQIGHSYGQEMRSLFLPEEGCMLSSLDYSQIEYLLLAHFAQGPQSEWFRQQALNGVDFHTVAMEATGIPSRSIVKTFNYGVIYGMGWRRAMTNNYVLFDKAAKEHDTDIETYVKQIYNDYHARLPVIRDTMSAVQNVTKIQGYIMTIGGRYQNKPKAQWDPATGKMNDYIYKMLNKLIQGSAADILKWAMLDAYESGILNELKMHLTVHDELVVSSPYNKIGTEAIVELKRIMEGSFHGQLKVPMRAACSVGPNWGYWNDDIWEDMKNGKFDRQKDTWWGEN